MLIALACRDRRHDTFIYLIYICELELFRYMSWREVTLRVWLTGLGAMSRGFQLGQIDLKQTIYITLHAR